ncbi:MAG: FAD-dependent monooxygenase, partial [Halobacteriales archaeon]|nr:FAD-dependent monooxygenase [Halobacteriales archaeon]
GEEVQAAGGLKLDMSEDLSWYDQGGFLADATEELPALYASRPLFEHLVRERIRERDEVQLRGTCSLLGYEHDASEGRVTGVRFRDGAGERTLTAALVVDATGRTSRTPKWLEMHGYPTPTVDRVTVDVTYSSVRIHRPPEERSGVLVGPEPDRPRGAAMLPAEGNRWEVVLQGMHGERAPTDRETFVEWTEALPVDDVGRQVAEREWLSEIHHYPFPASIWRHYEELDRFPDGLVVTGDAIASFNPIYGQGMSVAALDALVLHHELGGGLDGLGPRFFSRASQPVEEAWRLAVGNDFNFQETSGPKPFGADLFNRYVARLVRRAHDDGALTEAFFRVFRLERSVTSLLHPRIAWRVLGPRLGPGTGGDRETARSSAEFPTE